MSKRRDKQRSDALSLANERRVLIAALRKSLRRGDVDALSLVRGESEHEEIAAQLKLRALMRSLPGIGQARADRVMTRWYMAGNPSSAKLGDLTIEQRAELARLIDVIADKRVAS